MSSTIGRRVPGAEFSESVRWTLPALLYERKEDSSTHSTSSAGPHASSRANFVDSNFLSHSTSSAGPRASSRANFVDSNFQMAKTYRAGFLHHLLSSYC